MADHYGQDNQESARARYAATTTLSARSVPHREWKGSQSVHALHEYNPGLKNTAAEQKSAGLTRAEAAYHEAGYYFTRGDRQRIRALYSDALLTGEKVPAKQILRDIPCQLKPHLGRDGEEALKTPSQSARSHSTASAGTSRSATSQLSRARSDLSLSSNWIRQYRGNPEFLNDRYGTHNAYYGTGCKQNPFSGYRMQEPHKGREIWMHRTRQHPGRDNCLVTSHLYLPMLRSARGPTLAAPLG
mmetsp:Transcript_14013/g.34685  ORF Transcript_14013/g.34685 Transcript_14013/m.34685 type:complete len:244 (+) Transcript_14013:182-913(+)|eukprot:g9671.t1